MRRVQSEIEIVKKIDQPPGPLILLMQAFRHPIKTLSNPASQVANDIGLTGKVLNQIVILAFIFFASLITTLSLLVHYGPNNWITFLSVLVLDATYIIFSIRI